MGELLRASSMMLVQALTPQEKKWLGIRRNLLKCIKKLMVCRSEERLAKESVPVTANFSKWQKLPSAGPQPRGQGAAGL